MCSPRANPHAVDKLVEQAFLATRMDLHAAINQIAYMADEAQGFRLPQDKPAKAHTLNKPFNDDVNLRTHRAESTTTCPKNQGWSFKMRQYAG